jgi:hypothetical protein
VVDLRALAGRRYRVSLDESAELDGSEAERPWHLRIPCRYGHVYVHGRETLGAYTDRPGVIPRLLAVPGVRVHQRGDTEVTVTFPPDRLDAVAAVLKARRRRQLTEAERARRAAAVAMARLSVKKGASAA